MVNISLWRYSEARNREFLKKYPKEGIGMAGEVEVIKAVEGNGTRRRNMIGNGLSIDRKRVAANVRVSMDGEEQLQSFQSQK